MSNILYLSKNGLLDKKRVPDKPIYLSFHKFASLEECIELTNDKKIKEKTHADQKEVYVTFMICYTFQTKQIKRNVNISHYTSQQLMRFIL